MEDREILREHATPRTQTYYEIRGGSVRSIYRTLSATIRTLTCEDCPLRGATKSVQEQSLEMLEQLNESVSPTTDDVEIYVEEGFPDKSVDTFARCARTILRGNCDRYSENTETGCYIDVKGEL